MVVVARENGKWLLGDDFDRLGVGCGWVWYNLRRRWKMKKIEKEFEQIAAFIRARRNGAIGFLNYAAVSTYWTV